MSEQEVEGSTPREAEGSPRRFTDSEKKERERDLFLQAIIQRGAREKEESARMDRSLERYELGKMLALAGLSFAGALAFGVAYDVMRHAIEEDSLEALGELSPVTAFVTGSMAITGGCVAGAVFLARKHWGQSKGADSSVGETIKIAKGLTAGSEED